MPVRSFRASLEEVGFSPIFLQKWHPSCFISSAPVGHQGKKQHRAAKPGAVRSKKDTLTNIYGEV
jgi:hypothetical protein